MDNYIISDQEEILDAEPPFPNKYTNGVKIMQINKNTKFVKIINLAIRMFQEESAHHLIFRGIGDAADKCISCVEVLKRKTEVVLYQWNALNLARRVTYWDPLIDGLDRLKVTVDTPVMFILVSKDPFPEDLKCPSMQCSTDKGDFSNQEQTSSEGPKRTPLFKTKRQNKWMRPNKNERVAQHNERDEILEALDK